MHLFLSLHIVEDPLTLTYNPPLEGPIHSFDLDNYSDDLVTGTAVKAIEQAERIAILITTHSDISKLGNMLKLLNKLSRIKKPKLFIHNGTHPVVNKMLAAFRHDVVYHNLADNEVREEAKAFLI